MCISKQMLEDFIIGRLDDQRETKVRAYLRDHPDKAKEFEKLKLQNLMLRELGADVLKEPVPERLKQVLRQVREK